MGRVHCENILVELRIKSTKLQNSFSKNIGIFFAALTRTSKTNETQLILKTYEYLNYDNILMTKELKDKF